MRFVEFTASNPWLQRKKAQSYSNIYFRLASKARSHRIDPYNIVDLLGDMGGLLDIVMAFGAILTAREVRRAFDRSLLRDAYQVQSYSRDQSEFYHSSKAQ